jgi:hypothetical protein
VPFPSDEVIEKAEYLHVYPLMSAGGISGVIVRGYTDAYRVFAHHDGIMCECRAGSDHTWAEPRCSHALAAMLYWGEHTPTLTFAAPAETL